MRPEYSIHYSTKLAALLTRAIDTIHCLHVLTGINRRTRVPAKRYLFLSVIVKIIMDDYTKNLLISWDLLNLCDTFKDHYIDENTMPLLDEVLIKELIPEVGIRIKFLLQWNKTFKKDDTSTNNEVEDRNENMVHKNKKRKHSDANADVGPYALVRQNASLGQTAFMHLTNKSTIRGYLEEDTNGIVILNSYKGDEPLPNTASTLINNIIVSNLLKESKCLKNEHLKKVANCIVEIFPKDALKTYYISPKKKMETRKMTSIPSRGKLVDRYHNQLRLIRKLEKSLSATSTSSALESDETNEGENEIANISFEWLKTHCAPWKEVEIHWQNTFNYRRREIEKSKGGKVDELINQWPILKCSDGYRLINWDYTNLKLTTVNNLIENWNEFFDSIRCVQTVQERDETAATLIKFLDEDLTVGSVTDCRFVIQVLLLSHLIPPKGRIRVKKNHFKYSISECKESMIIHAVVPGDITVIRERRISVAKKRGGTIQPYIIVVGETLKEISEFYICLDQVLYEIPSALSALDTLFKIYHALDVGYPPESEHLWLLMQLSLYKFTTKFDSTISYIETIVNRIAIMQSQKSHAKEIAEVDTDTVDSEIE